jgi:hypothetical protein
MSAAKRLIKLGDFVQVRGELCDRKEVKELIAHSWEVLERWAVRCRGRSFIPDQSFVVAPVDFMTRLAQCLSDRRRYVNLLNSSFFSVYLQSSKPTH